MLKLLFLICSYLPFMCLSDDKNYGTLVFRYGTEIKTRFSLITIYCGGDLYHFITIKENGSLFGNMKLYEHISLENVPEKFYDETELSVQSGKYKKHLERLNENDALIEKEKLIYHIDMEKKRKERFLQKLNLYIAVVVGMMAIFISQIINFDMGNISSIKIVVSFIVCYAVINVALLIITIVESTLVKRSKFADLRNSSEKMKCIIYQFYFDWQNIRMECDRISRYMWQLEKWLLIFLLMLLMWLFVLKL